MDLDCHIAGSKPVRHECLTNRQADSLTYEDNRCAAQRIPLDFSNGANPQNRWYRRGAPCVRARIDGLGTRAKRSRTTTARRDTANANADPHHLERGAGPCSRKNARRRNGVLAERRRFLPDRQRRTAKTANGAGPRRAAARRRGDCRNRRRRRMAPARLQQPGRDSRRGDRRGTASRCRRQLR